MMIIKRKINNNLKIFLNNKIRENKKEWKWRAGSNFGIKFQILIGDYYKENKQKFDIEEIKVNLNPNDKSPDIVLRYKDNSLKKIEIKSCKNSNLNGVTICNSPELLEDTPCFLVDYYINDDSIVEISNVYETELHRLVTINSSGKYKGCLSSTRDTGKKLKGRNFNNFISTSPDDDYSLEELKNPNLIKKTILMYSVSKLIDENYNYSSEDIIDAFEDLKKNIKK